MPEKLFQNWVEESAKLKRTPSFDHLAEYLRRFQMRFCGRTDVVKTNSSSTTHGRSFAHRSKPTSKPSTLHVQSTKHCQLCPTDTHPLYLCDVFKAQSVDDRQSTVSRLKVCVNCLSYHILRECPSTRSCCHCGRKHHSLLHRGYQKRTNKQQSQSTSASQQQPQPTSASQQQPQSTSTSQQQSQSTETNSESTTNTSAHALPSSESMKDRPIAFFGYVFGNC